MCIFLFSIHRLCIKKHLCRTGDLCFHSCCSDQRFICLQVTRRRNLRLTVIAYILVYFFCLYVSLIRYIILYFINQLIILYLIVYFIQLNNFWHAITRNRAQKVEVWVLFYHEERIFTTWFKMLPAHAILCVNALRDSNTKIQFSRLYDVDDMHPKGFSFFEDLHSICFQVVGEEVLIFSTP